MQTQTTTKITVQVEVEVNEDWIDLCTKYNDIFMRQCCGYWAYGEPVVAADGELRSWLVFEQGDNDRPSDDEIAKALKAQESGATLPKGWFALNRETAIKAFVEGVKRKGTDWYENADATDYDCAVQLALLGEVRYG